MKIKLLIGTSLLSLLLLCSCSSKEAKDPAKNDEVQYPENGVYYEYSSGGNSDRVVRSLTFENGKEISRNEYDYWDNGKLREIKTMVGETVTDTWSYNYSTDGLLSQMVRQYTEDGEKCRDDYRYDEKGNVTLISLYTDDAYIGGERFTYTKNGDASLEERLDANGEVITYTSYTFDESGKNVTLLEKFMYGSRVEYGTYEYNESGLLSSVKYYSSKDVLTKEIKNEYNADGKIKRVLTCDAEGTVLGYTECLYDKDGFNFRDIFYEDGKPVYRYDYTKEGARIYSAYN